MELPPKGTPAVQETSKFTVVKSSEKTKKFPHSGTVEIPMKPSADENFSCLSTQRRRELASQERLARTVLKTHSIKNICDQELSSKSKSPTARSQARAEPTFSRNSAVAEKHPSSIKSASNDDEASRTDTMAFQNRARTPHIAIAAKIQATSKTGPRGIIHHLSDRMAAVCTSNDNTTPSGVNQREQRERRLSSRLLFSEEPPKSETSEGPQLRKSSDQKSLQVTGNKNQGLKADEANIPVGQGRRVCSSLAFRRSSGRVSHYDVPFKIVRGRCCTVIVTVLPRKQSLCWSQDLILRGGQSPVSLPVDGHIGGESQAKMGVSACSTTIAGDDTRSARSARSAVSHEEPPTRSISGDSKARGGGYFTVYSGSPRRSSDIDVGTSAELLGIQVWGVSSAGTVPPRHVYNGECPTSHQSIATARQTTTLLGSSCDEMSEEGESENTEHPAGSADECYLFSTRSSKRGTDVEAKPQKQNPTERMVSSGGSSNGATKRHSLQTEVRVKIPSDRGRRVSGIVESKCRDAAVVPELPFKEATFVRHSSGGASLRFFRRQSSSIAYAADMAPTKAARSTTVFNDNSGGGLPGPSCAASRRRTYKKPSQMHLARNDSIRSSTAFSRLNFSRHGSVSRVPSGPGILSSRLIACSNHRGNASSLLDIARYSESSHGVREDSGYMPLRCGRRRAAPDNEEQNTDDDSFPDFAEMSTSGVGSMPENVIMVGQPMIGDLDEVPLRTAEARNDSTGRVLRVTQTAVMGRPGTVANTTKTAIEVLISIEHLGLNEDCVCEEGLCTCKPAVVAVEQVPLFTVLHREQTLWCRQMKVHKNLLFAARLVGVGIPAELEVPDASQRMFELSDNLPNVHSFMERVVPHLKIENVSDDVELFWWRPIKNGLAVLQNTNTGKLVILPSADKTVPAAVDAVAKVIDLLKTSRLSPAPNGFWYRDDMYPTEAEVAEELQETAFDPISHADIPNLVASWGHKLQVSAVNTKYVLRTSRFSHLRYSVGTDPVDAAMVLIQVHLNEPLSRGQHAFPVCMTPVFAKSILRGALRLAFLQAFHFLKKLYDVHCQAEASTVNNTAALTSDSTSVTVSSGPSDYDGTSCWRRLGIESSIPEDSVGPGTVLSTEEAILPHTRLRKMLPIEAFKTTREECQEVLSRRHTPSFRDSFSKRLNETQPFGGESNGRREPVPRFSADPSRRPAKSSRNVDNGGSGSPIHEMTLLDTMRSAVVASSNERQRMTVGSLRPLGSKTQVSTHRSVLSRR